ncbi:MAG: hypothetical protein KBT11_09660 [Treponema sp.]|nr:hypothetical protein [Candidatus Treponema equifaecale]
MALSLVFGFASCGEDSDDDFNIITKDNSDNFTINFKNEDATAVKRGYETTTNKHSGALTQITLNKSDNGAGAIGYMWDLEAAGKDGKYSRAAKDTRRFCIVGLSYMNNKVRPYVSMYKDVVDIQANNFGVASAAGKENKENTDAAAVGNATETEYLKLSSNATYNIADSAVEADADGNFVITIDVYEDGEFSWNAAKTKRVYTSYNGGYKVDIYNGAVTTADIADSEKTAITTTVVIPADDLGYVAKKNPTDMSKAIVDQQTCAVYANVYGGKTMNAKVKYASTYAAAEVVEE